MPALLVVEQRVHESRCQERSEIGRGDGTNLNIKDETYYGFTYNPRWKADCKNGIHLWDEVLSADGHYLVCDECQLMIRIESKAVDRSYEEPEYSLNKKLEEI